MSENIPLPIEGIAREIKPRTEGSGESPEYVWTFRLERTDANGNLLPPISVEMRGRKFEGALYEGHKVKVDGEWREGTLEATQVLDQESQALFKIPVLYQNRTVLLIGLGVVAVFCIGFLVFAGFLTKGPSVPPNLPTPNGFPAIDACTSFQSKISFDNDTREMLITQRNNTTSVGGKALLDSQIHAQETTTAQDQKKFDDCKKGTPSP